MMNTVSARNGSEGIHQMSTHDISGIVRESLTDIIRQLTQRMDDVEASQRERERQLMNQSIVLNDHVQYLAELRRY